jgi:hypothetical protein
MLQLGMIFSKNSGHLDTFFASLTCYFLRGLLVGTGMHNRRDMESPLASDVQADSRFKAKSYHALLDPD